MQRWRTLTDGNITDEEWDRDRRRRSRREGHLASLLDQFGFNTVDAGPLKEGGRIRCDPQGYGPRRTAEELRKDLAAAKRYAAPWVLVARVAM